MAKIRDVKIYLLQNGFVEVRNMPHGTLFENPKNGRKTTLNQDRKGGEVSKYVLAHIKRQTELSFEGI